MRIATVIMAALASIALDVGVFIYWIGTALTCLDSCPPVEGFAGAWYSRLTTTLGAGLVLALVATILAIVVLSANRRWIGLVVAIAAPLLTLLAAALMMQFLAGGFTPVGGPTPYSDGTPIVSNAWITGAQYAALPLAVWPVVTFIVTLPLALRSAPSATPSPQRDGISA